MEQATQRRFAVMGDNTFKIANRLMQDQQICRLLKYQTKDPFLKIDPVTGKEQLDVDGIDLIHKQILIVPKVFDDNTEKMSYVISVHGFMLLGHVHDVFRIYGDL